MHANITRSIRVGLFFLFGASLIWIVHETFTEANLYSETGYPIRAPFEDLKQLKLGSDVRLAGVSIGAVTDLRLEDGEAVAELSIERSFKIAIDSVATITTAGLLGNNYVAIQAGDKSEFLIEGDSIKTRQTADVSEVVAKVGEIGEKISRFLDSMSSDGDGSMFDKFNSMVDDIGPKLNRILDNVELVTDNLRNGTGTMGKLMQEDTAYNELLSVADEIKAAANDAKIFFNDAQGLVDKLSNGNGPLAFILDDEQAAGQLRDTVANINEFSDKLNSNNSTLGKLIADDKLYKEAESILNKVSNAVDGVENSGPITAVGVTAGALF